MTSASLQSLDDQHGGDHYKGLAIEPAEYILRNNMGFAEGSAIKYITRHEMKGGAEDLLKAIHYCQMILEMRYGVIATMELEYTDKHHHTTNEEDGM